MNGAVQLGSAAYYLLSVMDAPGTARDLEARAWETHEADLSVRASPELTGSMGGLVRSGLVEILQNRRPRTYARTLAGEVAVARAVTRDWKREEAGGTRVIRCVSVVLFPGEDAHVAVTTQLVDGRGRPLETPVTRSFADFRERHLTGGKHEE